MVKLFKLSAVGLMMNWWLVGRVVEQLIAPSTQMKLTNNQFHFSRRMSFSVSVMSVHNNIIIIIIVIVIRHSMQEVLIT